MVVCIHTYCVCIYIYEHKYKHTYMYKYIHTRTCVCLCILIQNENTCTDLISLLELRVVVQLNASYVAFVHFVHESQRPSGELVSRRTWLHTNE